MLAAVVQASEKTFGDYGSSGGVADPPTLNETIGVSQERYTSCYVVLFVNSNHSLVPYSRDDGRSVLLLLKGPMLLKDRCCILRRLPMHHR
jgi:hypothetical protein